MDLSAEHSALIQKWFFNLPTTQEETAVFLSYCKLFEAYRLDTDCTKSKAELLDIVRTAHSPESLFHPAALHNHDAIKIINKHLHDYGFKMEPNENASNTRVSIKVSSRVYPGEDYRQERLRSRALINEYYRNTEEQRIALAAGTPLPTFTAAATSQTAHQSTAMPAYSSVVTGTPPTSNPGYFVPPAATVQLSQPQLVSEHQYVQNNHTTRNPPISTTNQAQNPMIRKMHQLQIWIDMNATLRMQGLPEYPLPESLQPSRPASHHVPTSTIPVSAIYPLTTALPATTYHHGYTSAPTANPYQTQNKFHAHQAPRHQAQYTPSSGIYSSQDITYNRPTQYNQIPGIYHPRNVPRNAGPQQAPPQATLHGNPEIRQFSHLEQSRGTPHMSREHSHGREYRSHGSSASHAASISKRFSYKDQQFSGSEDEDFQEFVDKYLDMCNDLEVSPRDKNRFIHNLFRGEALRVYNARVRGQTEVLGEALQIMRNHFNPPSKQNNIKADLLSLRFQSFLVKADGNRRLALKSLVSYIEKWHPQCSPEWKTMEHKVSFLRGAMLSERWALPYLSGLDKNSQFDEVYQKLASIIQIEEDAAAQLHANNSNTRRSDPITSKPSIFFQKYGQRVVKKIFPGQHKDTNCWNCGHDSHRVAKCRKPLNPKAIAARKAKFFEKKRNSRNANKRVLHELVSGLEELFEADTADSDEEVNTYFEIHDSDSDTDPDNNEQDNTPVEPVIGFTTADSSEDSDLGF